MDLLNLVANEEQSTVKNTVFLNIYLKQGEQRLQLVGLGLETQVNSKFNTKNQKAFFTKLLEASKAMQEGETKVILDGTISLELLKVKAEGNTELTNSLLGLLDL